MPTFTYLALDAEGKQVKGEVVADALTIAISQVRAKGYFPTQVTEKKAKARGFNINMNLKFGGKVNPRQLTLFTRQLSTLIEAGLPLLRSINVLRNQLKPGKFQDTLSQISGEIEGGSTFSEALGKHPRVFSKLYINMVKAGEAGGVLEKVLDRLATFSEKDLALKKKIKAALIYPITVVIIIGIVLYVIFSFVIPKFTAMYEDVGSALPAMTLFLIKASDIAKTKGWYLVPAIVIGMAVVFKLINRTSKGKYFIDKTKLRLIIFGPLVQKAVVARITRTLGTLLGSGVQILSALNIVRETAGNEVFSRAISQVHDSIREGESIAAPLQTSRIFPPMVINMIDVGEETGALDTMLMKIADTYDEEVDIAVSGLTTLLEPILIVFMGAIVGFIVISLFLPLIKLASQIGV
jgi:type IV pilus assembly protein PilC